MTVRMRLRKPRSKLMHCAFTMDIIIMALSGQLNM